MKQADEVNKKVNELNEKEEIIKRLNEQIIE